MNLQIDHLNIDLPASMGARRYSILRQLRSELVRLDWPKGQWSELRIPTISVSARQTNISIAREIARQFYRAALARSLANRGEAVRHSKNTGGRQ